MQPVLIGLHSVKNGGKNTTADFISAWCASRHLTCKQRAFAEKAKWAFARQFFPNCAMEWAIEWFDSLKNTDASVEIWTEHSASIANVQFRQCMAQFSTESARDIYGKDHWVDQLLPDDKIIFADFLKDEYDYHTWHESFTIDGGKRIAHVCPITDLRFENELRRIHKLHGITIKIRRKDAENKAIEDFKKNGIEVHESELGLPDEMFDYVINNDDNDMDLARKRTESVLNGVHSIQLIEYYLQKGKELEVPDANR